MLSGGSRAPKGDAWTAATSAPDARFRDLPRDASALPPLSDSFSSSLDAGLVALGLTLPDHARAAIDAHVRLLLAWNAAFNLTAITDPDAVATRHVLDSLAAIPLLTMPVERSTPARPPRADRLRLIDLGSGGGFPGMTLAAALPHALVTLVDSVTKKARFLEAAAEASGLDGRVSVRAARAEDLGRREGGSWDVVTARAVGSMPDLVELAMPLLRVGGRLLAWKRGELGDELDAGARAATMLGGSVPEVRPVALPGLAGHVLVEVRKLRPTPSGFPRDPGGRNRHAW